MTKVPLKDRSDAKLELIQAIMAGYVQSITKTAIKPGTLAAIQIEVAFDPEVMRTLNAIEVKSRVGKQKK